MMVEQNKCIFYMMIFEITCNRIEKEFDRDHINNKKLLKAKKDIMVMMVQIFMIKKLLN